MKTKLWTVLASLWVLVVGGGALTGCNDDAGTPVTSRAAEPVVRHSVDTGAELPSWQILGGHRSSSGYVEVDLLIDGERHRLTSRPDGNGRQFELANGEGEQFGVAIDPTDNRVSEWTATDRLDIRSVRDLDDLRTETYNLNGRERSWTFDPDADVTEGERHALSKEFRAFMPESSSLNDNPLGQTLVELLTDERLPDEIVARGLGAGGYSEQERPSPALQWTCGIFAECARMKCTFGGLSNSLCAFCASGTIICVLMVIFG